MKNLLISALLIAVGVWYFHRVADDRAHPTKPPEETQAGEIVVAKAPDGSIQQRWHNSSATPASSR